MKKEMFDDLLASVKEAGEIRRGTRKASRSYDFAADDVKAIRSRLKKSQTEFAMMIGVRVAARSPDVVAKALTGKWHQPPNCAPRDTAAMAPSTADRSLPPVWVGSWPELRAPGPSAPSRGHRSEIAAQQRVAAARHSQHRRCCTILRAVDNG
jgi:hypothetical protein